MLSKKKKAYFEKLLIRMLEDAKTNADAAAGSLAYEKDASLDFADQASVESDRDLALHIHERGSRLIRKITEALNRLEMGRFGICEECGEEISLKRLEARPVATRCIECKKEQEAKEKARGV